AGGYRKPLSGCHQSARVMQGTFDQIGVPIGVVLHGITPSSPSTELTVVADAPVAASADAVLQTPPDASFPAGNTACGCHTENSTPPPPDSLAPHPAPETQLKALSSRAYPEDTA